MQYHRNAYVANQTFGQIKALLLRQEETGGPQRVVRVLAGEASEQIRAALDSGKATARVK